MFIKNKLLTYLPNASEMYSNESPLKSKVINIMTSGVNDMG